MAGQGVKKGEIKLEEKLEILQKVADSVLSEIKSLKFATECEDEDDVDFYEKVGRYETHLIEKALEKAKGNQAKAARLLNLKPSTLNMKMKTLGMI